MINLTSRDMENYSLDFQGYGRFYSNFRVRTHYLSSDISSDLSMKNTNINIKSHNENVNEDMNDNI